MKTRKRENMEIEKLYTQISVYVKEDFGIEFTAG